MAYTIHLAVRRFNENSKHINVEMMTEKGIRLSILEDFYADALLLELSIFMVGLYTTLNIGGLSPIHCRCCVTITGFVCVGVCYFAGFSIAFMIG